MAKIDCVGDVQKQLGTRLRKLVKFPDGSRVAKANPRKTRIDSIQNYFGQAIRSHVTVMTLKVCRQWEKQFFTILLKMRTSESSINTAQRVQLVQIPKGQGK